MFGHSLLPVCSGGRLLFGWRCVCDVMVVVDSSVPAPYSQDLSWPIIWFVWNLGLAREEVVFYLQLVTFLSNMDC